MGPLKLRWYGVMYLLGFIAGYFVIRSELRRKSGPIEVEEAGDLLFYLILGLLLGGRIGYVLIYNLPVYIYSPLEIVALWHGGMSFHGGLLGMIVAGWIFVRGRGVPFLELADIGAIAGPIGLMLGRIGNFINGELYGRVTTLAWGIGFPMGGPCGTSFGGLRRRSGGTVLLAYSVGRTQVRAPGKIFPTRVPGCPP